MAKNPWKAAVGGKGSVGSGGGGGSSRGYTAPAYAATGNSRIRSTDSSRIQDIRPRDQAGNIYHSPGSYLPPVQRDPDAPKPGPPKPPSYTPIMPDRPGTLGPKTPKMGAAGLNGSYGMNTATNPARRVGSGSGAW